jgi:hypothetical protein
MKASSIRRRIFLITFHSLKLALSASLLALVLLKHGKKETKYSKSKIEITGRFQPKESISLHLDAKKGFWSG